MKKLIGCLVLMSVVLFTFAGPAMAGGHTNHGLVYGEGFVAEPGLSIGKLHEFLERYDATGEVVAMTTINSPLVVIDVTVPTAVSYGIPFDWTIRINTVNPLYSFSWGFRNPIDGRGAWGTCSPGYWSKRVGSGYETLYFCRTTINRINNATYYTLTVSAMDSRYNSSTWTTDVLVN